MTYRDRTDAHTNAAGSEQMNDHGGASVPASTARGVVYLHSVPKPLIPHVEWSLANVLDTDVKCSWEPQPAQPGTWRAEYLWRGAPETSTQLASALNGWDNIRFEVTEDAPSVQATGHRYSYTPTLGMFHATTSAIGDVLIPERVLLTALDKDADGAAPIRIELAKILGQPWDDELEVFRYALDSTPVQWIHAI